MFGRVRRFGRRPTGKTKTKSSRRAAASARAPRVGGFTVFSITGNLRESECVCVFIHDVADRREAKRDERKTPAQPPPHLFFHLFSVSFLFGSRLLDGYRLRRRGTRRKGTREDPWGVSEVAPESGSGGARSSASETKIRREKNHATLASSPRRRRFRVCVTKEGLSAPDRSSEKSANAFLMSGAERRREERVPFESRAKKNKRKNANREGKRNPHAPRRTRSLGRRRRARAPTGVS